MAAFTPNAPALVSPDASSCAPMLPLASQPQTTGGKTLLGRSGLQPRHPQAAGGRAFAPGVGSPLCDTPDSFAPRPPSTGEAGLTLVELIITVAIVSILASAAVPVARFEVKREKERELRRDLWEMRDGIDRYKDAAEKGAFQTKADSINYPPDLQTLVDGVDIQGKKVRFLRAIPTDPMTHSTEWGLRSNQDDPDSDSFGGQNVFDVHSKSEGTGLDGTKYNTW